MKWVFCGAFHNFCTFNVGILDKLLHLQALTVSLSLLALSITCVPRKWPMKIANAAAALWTGRHITISNRHINFDLNGLVNVSNDFLSQAKSPFYTEPINLDGQAGVCVCVSVAECRMHFTSTNKKPHQSTEFIVKNE